MKGIEKNIREQFRITDRMTAIDEKRKKESLSFLQKEIFKKELSKRKSGIIDNRKKTLLRQFRYMDKSMLRIHIAFCMVSILFMIVLYKCADNGKLMIGIEENEIILIFTIISGFQGMISILAVGHVFFSGIAELSESCYFNVRQMVAFQMFLSGIISLTVLFLNMIFVSMQWKMNFIRIGLYIMVPFLVTECCCLMIVLTEVGRKNSYLLAAVGVFVAVCNSILASLPELYRVTALSIWGIAFVIGLLLLTIQIKMLFRGIEKGDILCTN